MPAPARSWFIGDDPVQIQLRPLRVLRPRKGSIRWEQFRDGDPLGKPHITIEIWCGPEAPYPLPPTPEQILDGAAWFALPRVDEDRELRILTSVAEWELGLYD